MKTEYEDLQVIGKFFTDPKYIVQSQILLVGRITAIVQDYDRSKNSTHLDKLITLLETARDYGTIDNTDFENGAHFVFFEKLTGKGKYYAN